MAPTHRLRASGTTHRRALLRALGGLVLSGPLGLQAAGAAPPEVAGEVPEARLVGQGRLRYFGLHIYDAELWAGPSLAAGDTDYARQPLALVLRYARSLDGAKIAERSIEEMRRIGAFSAEQSATWLRFMNEAFPDVQDGDRLTGLYRPGEAAAFAFNGKPRATLRDAEFARLFFGIWLAPTTSQPGLRARLLGLKA
ncbi:chalcone isomerase family protein [Aquariibacter albus]|uniref:Chalcone isomerase family protein n=1 Tax=Aquariibacter albus TaxID=2759899 RepID=A0A839HR17_9BURK|nr:chalcone isomerase family protein [Aquariibacter albus]MBB1161900.1 chalcone isomerase family protein [Aquariibacter albus]